MGPLLRVVNDLNFKTPTPVQQKTIKKALRSHNVRFHSLKTDPSLDLNFFLDYSLRRDRNRQNGRVWISFITTRSRFVVERTSLWYALK
jgi:hypothetical protein